MVDPGAIFSLLGNIIELTKKSEEHNDELKELHQNSEILLSLMKELDSTNVINENFKEDILKDLDEAKKLLESPEVTKWSQKLIIGIMGMLPGNKTSQLKEKNEKIFRQISRIKALIDVNNIKNSRNGLATSVVFQNKSASNPNGLNRNLSENDQPLPTTHGLKRTKTESLNSTNIFEPTLNENLLVAATIVQNQMEGEMAYEISWEGDKTIFEQYLIANKDFDITETLNFREIKEDLIKNDQTSMKEIYSVGRGKFMMLIKNQSEKVKNFLNLISGNHLKIFLQKIKVAISENTEIMKAEIDHSATVFFTCEAGEGGITSERIEENKKNSEQNISYDFEFYVQDNSTNGTYICKKKRIGKPDAWERLPSKQMQLLEDGDKIGIVMDTLTHQMLILGFMFRKIQY